MAKTVEFTVKNSKVFTSYLKKFASIDNTVLFEADFKNSRFVTKSPNEERSAVKFGSISFDEAEFETSSKLDIRIKIGIYSIPRLIKIIDQFTKEFQFIIRYDEVIGSDKEVDYAALSILLKSDELKFNNECTSLNIFKYISDDTWENKIKKIDEVISFQFKKEDIEKIRALCELDKEYNLIEFKNKEKGLYARGKSFELLITTTTEKDISIPIFKELFEKVDVELSNVIIGSDRVLFSSEDTDTEIVLSKAEGNENYEESNDDIPF
jgi:hypothetical protein